MNLTPNELQLLKKLIELACNTLKYDGSYRIENTEENWRLLVEIEEDAVGKPFYEIPANERDYAERPSIEVSPRLRLSSWMLLRYLGRKLV